MRRKLTEALAPTQLAIIDESHRHAGHAGARPEGETHFRIEIVSAKFAGLSRIERQRLVHQVLASRTRRPRPRAQPRDPDAGGSRLSRRSSLSRPPRTTVDRHSSRAAAPHPAPHHHRHVTVARETSAGLYIPNGASIALHSRWVLCTLNKKGKGRAKGDDNHVHFKKIGCGRSHIASALFRHISFGGGGGVLPRECFMLFSMPLFQPCWLRGCQRCGGRCYNCQ